MVNEMTRRGDVPGVRGPQGDGEPPGLAGLGHHQPPGKNGEGREGSPQSQVRPGFGGLIDYQRPSGQHRSSLSHVLRCFSSLCFLSLPPPLPPLNSI